MVILVINCGSTTLKYQLFRVHGTGLSSLASGAVEIRRGYRQAVTETLQFLPAAPEAIAHRVVHGGAPADRCGAGGCRSSKPAA